MVEWKAFLANLEDQYHVSQCGGHHCSVHNRKNRVYYKYPNLLFSHMNFDYKENAKRNAFITNQKHQYLASQWEEHDCSAHNKQNRVY